MLDFDFPWIKLDLKIKIRPDAVGLRYEKPEK